MSQSRNEAARRLLMVARLAVTACFLSLICTYAQAQRRLATGYNAVAIGPVLNNGGTGVGLFYERWIDHRRRTSLTVQLSEQWGFTEYGLQRGTGHAPRTTGLGCLLRYYTGGSRGIARYSIGAGVFAGWGQDGFLQGYGAGRDYGFRSFEGFMISNSLHFHITPLVRTSLFIDLGIGDDQSGNGFNTSPALMIQLGMNAGLRF